jgi:hypothetical protein
MFDNAQNFIELAKPIIGFFPSTLRWIDYEFRFGGSALAVAA